MATTYLTPWGTPGAAIGVYDVFASGGDVTAPVLTSPAATLEVFSFGLYASVTTDSPGEGTGYAVVTASATPPSVAQVQAGQDHLGAAALSAVSVANPASNFGNMDQLGGLPHNTSGLYVHYQHQDAAGNDSTVATSATSFATDDAAPTGTATGATTAVGTLTVSFNTGTVWWVVTESATTPSIAQIQAGQDHTGSAAVDDGSETASNPGSNEPASSGLTAETTYYFHFQYENEDNVDSPALSSGSFTTLAVATDDYLLRLRDGTYRRRYSWGA